jgi:hypothetical protein
LRYCDRSHAITRGAKGRVSGNTREGRFLRSYKLTLLRELDGEPTQMGRLYIADIARLALIKEQLDARLAGGGLSDDVLRSYRNLVNSLEHMRRNFLQHRSKMVVSPPEPPRQPTLAEVLRDGSLGEASRGPESAAATAIATGGRLGDRRNAS